jgi:predicted  nucleic acid-binding Zn-ribbon protein
MRFFIFIILAGYFTTLYAQGLDVGEIENHTKAVNDDLSGITDSLSSINKHLEKISASLDSVNTGSTLQTVIDAINSANENFNKDSLIAILKKEIGYDTYKTKVGNIKTIIDKTKDKSKELEKNVKKLGKAIDKEFQSLKKQNFADTVEETDLLNLKDDYIQIKQSITNIVFNLRKSTTEIIALRDHLYGIIKTSDEIIDSLRTAKPRDIGIIAKAVLKAEILNNTTDKEFETLYTLITEIVFNLSFKKDLMAQVYEIGLEKLEIEGKKQAQAVQTAFALPEVDVMELKLGKAEDIYLEFYDQEEMKACKGEKYIFINNKKESYNRNGKHYSNINAIEFRVDDYEMRFTNKVSFNNGKQEFYIDDIKFKYYYYVNEIRDVLETKVHPIIELTKNEAQALNKNQKEIRQLKDAKTNHKEKIVALENELKENPNEKISYAVNYYDRDKAVELGTDEYFFTINGEDTLSLTKEMDSSLVIVNLFKPQVLKPDYQSSRIKNGKFTISETQTVKLKAPGPSAYVWATVEALKNMGAKPKDHKSSVNNTSEFRLNFEGTKDLYPFGTAKATACLRYAKLGFNMIYKGDVNNIKIPEDPNAAKDTLINLYSEDAENLLYLSVPLISWRPRAYGNAFTKLFKAHSIYDFLVISPYVYFDSYKFTTDSTTNREDANFKFGLKVTAVDWQSYYYNFRFRLGCDWIDGQFEKGNDNPEWITYFFTSMDIGFDKDVFFKLGYRHKFKESNSGVAFASINYRINPLDVVEVIKGVIF